MEEGSALITPLNRAYNVDEAINTNEKHLLIIRFDNDADPTPSRTTNVTIKETDAWLESIASTYRKYVRIYRVKMSTVPELVARYKLSGSFTFIFFSDCVQVDRHYWDNTTEQSFKDSVKKRVKENKKTEAIPKLHTETTATLIPPPRNHGKKNLHHTRSIASSYLFRRFQRNF